VPTPVTESLQLQAILKSSSGEELLSTLTVSNTPLQGGFKLVKLDSSGSSALVYGTGLLRRVDLRSGSETVIYEGMVKDRTEPSTGIRVDPTDSSAYFLRWKTWLPWSDPFFVDLGAGDGKSFGEWSDNDLANYPGFDYDPVNSRLVMSYTTVDDHRVRGDRCFLVGAPLDGGALEFLAETTEFSDVPGAPDVRFCAGAVVVDAKNNRVIVSADGQAGPDWWLPPEQEYGLYAYDLTTGVGSVLSPLSEDFGPSLNTPKWIFLKSSGTEVVTVDEDRVMEVDLQSGMRRIVLDGIALPQTVTDVDFDEIGSRLLVANAMSEMMFLDLVSGDYESAVKVRLGSPVGSGVQLPESRYRAPVIDERRNRLFVFPGYSGPIYLLDLDTLERSAIEPQPSIDAANIKAAAVDPESGNLYFEGGSSSAPGDIWRLDPETGAVELITSNDTHSGILLNWVYGLSVDSKRGLLYASGDIAHMNDRAGLVAIDINSGNRRLVAEVPKGANYRRGLQKNVYDAENDRVIAATADDELVQIDLDSGEVLSLYTPDEAEYGSTDGLAIDSSTGRILHGLTDFRDGRIMETRSVDPKNGSYEVLADVPAIFGFDEKRSVFYTLDNLLRNGIPGQAFAIDRSGHTRAVIARPE